MSETATIYVADDGPRATPRASHAQLGIGTETPAVHPDFPWLRAADARWDNERKRGRWPLLFAPFDRPIDARPLDLTLPGEPTTAGPSP